MFLFKKKKDAPPPPPPAAPRDVYTTLTAKNASSLTLANVTAEELALIGSTLSGGGVKVNMRVSLSETELTVDGVGALCSALAAPKVPEFLHLQFVRCSFGDDAFRLLCSALSKRSFAHSLHIEVLGGHLPPLWGASIAASLASGVAPPQLMLSFKQVVLDNAIELICGSLRSGAPTSLSLNFSENRVTQADADALAEALQRSDCPYGLWLRLHALTFAEASEDTPGTDATAWWCRLFSCLHTAPYHLRLSIERNTLPEASFTALCDGLKQGTYPVYLRLALDCALPASSAAALGDALDSGKSPAHLYLDLSGGEADDDTMGAILGRVSARWPQWLSIAFPEVGEVAAKDVEAFLSRDVIGTLTVVFKAGAAVVTQEALLRAVGNALMSGTASAGLVLDFTSVVLTPGSVKVLADALLSGMAPPQLRLNLTSNRLSAESIAYLQGALSSGACPPQLALQLNNTQLCDASVASLSAALSSGRCPTYLNLDLTYTNMGTAAFEGFCAALGSARSPRHLQLGLRSNSLKEPALLQLGAALQQRTRFQSFPSNAKIDLKMNPFGDDEVAVLCSVLRSGRCPRRLALDLSGGAVLDTALAMLFAAVGGGQCPDALSLTLVRPRFGQASLLALRKALESPHCPQHLHVTFLHPMVVEAAGVACESNSALLDALCCSLETGSCAAHLHLNIKHAKFAEMYTRLATALTSGKCPDHLRVDTMGVAVRPFLEALPSGRCPKHLRVSVLLTSASLPSLCAALQSGGTPDALELRVHAVKVAAVSLPQLHAALRSAQCPTALQLWVSNMEEGSMGMVCGALVGGEDVGALPARLTIGFEAIVDCAAERLGMSLVAGRCPEHLHINFSEVCLTPTWLRLLREVVLSGLAPAGLTLTVGASSSYTELCTLLSSAHCPSAFAINFVHSDVPELMDALFSEGVSYTKKGDVVTAVPDLDHVSGESTETVEGALEVCSDAVWWGALGADTLADVAEARGVLNAAQDAVREEPSSTAIATRDTARTALLTVLQTASTRATDSASTLATQVAAVLAPLNHLSGASEQTTATTPYTAAATCLDAIKTAESVHTATCSLDAAREVHATALEERAQEVRCGGGASGAVLAAEEKVRCMERRRAAAVAAVLCDLSSVEVCAVVGALRRVLEDLRALHSQARLLTTMHATEAGVLPKEKILADLASLTAALHTAGDAVEDAGIAARRAARDTSTTPPELVAAAEAAKKQLRAAQRDLERQERLAATAVSYYPELAVEDRVREWGGLVSRRVLADYSDLQLLAQSRHAVWRCVAPCGTACVLKHFATDARGVARLLRESRILARIDHPCIAEVVCVFEDVSGWYMQMPYYSNGDLASFIEDSAPGRAARVQLLLDASQGLACAHRNDLVHCDVKTKNIFIDAAGKARLGDFDVSKDAAMRGDTATVTVVSTASGTAGFLAPEVRSGGSATRASDVYSLGLVAYDLLSSTVRTSETPVVSTATLGTEAAAALVTAMLAGDPAARPSAESVVLHPLFRQSCRAGAGAGADVLGRTPARWRNQRAVGEVVDVTSALNGTVQAMVNRSCNVRALGRGRDSAGLDHKGLKVEKVLRIEHAGLWQQYHFQRDRMQERLADSVTPRVEPLCFEAGLHEQELAQGLNEVHLFHGTKRAGLNAILSQGMDERVCVSGLYGAGLYFAENSSKSDAYMSPAEDGLCDLLICRVLVGTSNVCAHTFDKSNYARRRPPCVHGHYLCSEHEPVDSILAAVPNQVREFVVYDRTRVYPEYLVKIRRVQEQNPV